MPQCKHRGWRCRGADIAHVRHIRPWEISSAVIIILCCSQKLFPHYSIKGGFILREDNCSTCCHLMPALLVAVTCPEICACLAWSELARQWHYVLYVWCFGMYNYRPYIQRWTKIGSNKLINENTHRRTNIHMHESFSVQEQRGLALITEKVKPTWSACWALPLDLYFKEKLRSSKWEIISARKGVETIL